MRVSGQAGGEWSIELSVDGGAIHRRRRADGESNNSARVNVKILSRASVQGLCRHLVSGRRGCWQRQNKLIITLCSRAQGRVVKEMLSVERHEISIISMHCSVGRLASMNSTQTLNSRSLLRRLLRAEKKWDRYRRDDADNRDNDQKFNKREAALGGLECLHVRGLIEIPLCKFSPRRG